MEKNYKDFLRKQAEKEKSKNIDTSLLESDEEYGNFNNESDFFDNEEFPDSLLKEPENVLIFLKIKSI